MNPQNAPYQTRVLPLSDSAIGEAARLIGEGEAVAVPTETVYGLAADATNEQAVARIYAAKGRPSFNPLIVHVLDIDQAAGLGICVSEATRYLAESYWPGPLTLVLPVHPFTNIAKAVRADLDTVAIRSPASRAMRALIKACGKPLAAPSANASGGISPTRAEHVLYSLGGRIPLIIDGGAAEFGLESTIVQIRGDQLSELRPGPIDAEEVAVFMRLARDLDWNGRIEAPGQLASHYAPSKPLRLHAESAEAGEWLIGFGAVAGDETLSASGDLREAAANLFAALHRAEASAAPRIAVSPVPEDGIGRAINDRLRRAAAPR